MRVRVKLFAGLRVTAGWSEQQMTLPEDATVRHLLDQLEQEVPQLNLSDRAVYAAVNQEYAGVEALLADGDVVALFPPVSGGHSVGTMEDL